MLRCSVLVSSERSRIDLCKWGGEQRVDTTPEFQPRSALINPTTRKLLWYTLTPASTPSDNMVSTDQDPLMDTKSQVRYFYCCSPSALPPPFILKTTPNQQSIPHTPSLVDTMHFVTVHDLSRLKYFLVTLLNSDWIRYGISVLYSRGGIAYAYIRVYA